MWISQEVRNINILWGFFSAFKNTLEVAKALNFAKATLTLHILKIDFLRFWRDLFLYCFIFSIISWICDKHNCWSVYISMSDYTKENTFGVRINAGIRWIFIKMSFVVRYLFENHQWTRSVTLNLLLPIQIPLHYFSWINEP